MGITWHIAFALSSRPGVSGQEIIVHPVVNIPSTCEITHEIIFVAPHW